MPRILDLFCGAGGAGVGYARAGFEVVGVDLSPQPDYPFEFAEACALYVVGHGANGFDAIHASPPCQAYSALSWHPSNRHREYPDLMAEVRELLQITGLPYVIENVIHAPLQRDLVLCGEMFGLGVIRHRAFELGGWTMPQPPHKPHRGRVAGYRHGEWFDGPYFAVYGDGGGKGSVPEWQTAMGIDWTANRKSIAEAIPPAYTEHIGRELMRHLIGKEDVAA